MSAYASVVGSRGLGRGRMEEEAAREEDEGEGAHLVGAG